MSKEVQTTQLDHVHLHVDDIDFIQELFEKVFSMKTIHRTFVGEKEIVRMELGGAHILLSSTNAERSPGINHLGITTDHLGQMAEDLTVAGWELVEIQEDNELRKQFFKSPEGLLVELMEKK